MKLEKLKKKNYQKVIIGGLVAVSILSVLIYKTTSAKYRTTQSVNIAKGTINFKPYDLKVMAMYQSEDGTNYSEIDTMPANGYMVNEGKSYCTTDNQTKVKGKIKTINGNHILNNVTKNDKCYLYFDKIKITDVKSLIANSHINIVSPDFSKVATTDEGIYQASDGMYGGTSYYWRGAVKNNWVKFANMYWRIIRINGDGSIRLIYTGNSSLTNVGGNEVTATGAGTQIQTSAYNTNHDRPEYVGYKYTTGSQRPSSTTEGTASTIKGIIDTWYTNNIGNNTTYASKVADGKYCNDRTVSSSYTWSGQTSYTIHYAAYDDRQHTPTLSCQNYYDIYTLKAGLITIDEMVLAGGLMYPGNTKYYLYTGQEYWTMSPSSFTGDYAAQVFRTVSNGWLSQGLVHEAYGVRPVINLKADTIFAASGTGTKTNPYVVQ